ncbi:hypothetical protein KC332_g13515 [Hortaea werneckii]|nr:hypothetical protein KC358_g12642 [Hortaea werneckii]KAI6810034.1 hypothetical protein KC350_g12673 [Hortaea werneckii]KAI6911281.1 hypothetical protein KC348_g12981 [Hortaea werneckii]KAI6925689.1 hypothetical protein KC341_g13227 [Hortaea werneckii]KAI6960634.1 hypothetical protein KC321_g12748 [Hortaea werneckii]
MSWVGAWKFANDGNFGKTSLWVRQDSNGLINDRCVIKDTVLPVNMWNSKLHFAKDSRYPESEERNLPTEAAAHAALRPLEGSDTIIKMRNWRMASEQRMYRLYLEFAPHGDLYQFMSWYNDKMPVLREMSGESENEIAALEYRDSLKAFHEQRETNELEWLPEPFIWACFESLAKAGLLMEQGSLDENPLTKWDLIVHFDLKPSNVFLGVPSANSFVCCPQAKLGDFGLAQLFSPKDNAHFDKYCGRGTAYFCAPEQVPFALFGGPEEWTSATNVWGVGIIIWGLMELEEGDHRADFKTIYGSERSFNVKKDGWPLGKKLNHWAAPPPGMHAMPSPPFPEDLSAEYEIGGVEGAELEPLHDDASGESADEEMNIDDYA